MVNLGGFKQDNETTVHCNHSSWFLDDCWQKPTTVHGYTLYIYGVSKLSQTQVSCVWKSATNIRALKVELPTRYNVHRKDTYIPSLYDFGLAQTLSCTNQTWGEYFGKVLPFGRMYGMMYSHDKMMVNTKPLGPTISG